MALAGCRENLLTDCDSEFEENQRFPAILQVRGEYENSCAAPLRTSP
jgi:hypothetical protein